MAATYRFSKTPAMWSTGTAGSDYSDCLIDFENAPTTFTAALASLPTDDALPTIVCTDGLAGKVDVPSPPVLSDARKVQRQFADVQKPSDASILALAALTDGLLTMVDTDIVPHELQAFEGEQDFATDFLEAKTSGGEDWQRWRARREDRRTRLADRRRERLGKFGSKGHASFCTALCSSDCSLCLPAA
ncbi:unnamed protein product [Prorocentrum cordatum]|uniref:Cilia- and flagella-associated protein 206 n=1 Tax=Prorocentrum cordatum TaxID=2364126 RepID=A0ABN9W3N5_9DINO|nr:unnamed protein product [Polarella glacialis]|mmetsp:Transcript_31309/g.89362  ORF Transcript_31309/g.89362 Transcript_31309/m.89362 type:complete len:189 (+) Transcript_31309:90-656(+)